MWNQQLFDACDIIFKGRDTNKEAHSLVKFSVSLNQAIHMTLFDVSKKNMTLFVFLSPINQ